MSKCGVCLTRDSTGVFLGKMVCDVCYDHLEKYCLTNVLPDIKYTSLQSVLHLAYKQASEGKGRERHANDKAFTNQPICEIGRMVGLGYPLGQAMKKAQESVKLLEIKGKDAAKAELLGAINYLASACILLDEME